MKTELKFWAEQRTEKIEEMKNLVDTAKKEQRALTEEQIAAFEELKKAVSAIDATIAAEETAREEEIEVSEERKIKTTPENEENKETTETKEIRAFANHVRSKVLKLETRSDNLDMGSNGAIIPTTIAQKIIEKVKEICPIYSMAEIYHIKGKLVVPYYGPDGSDDITCAYTAEFTELTSKSGKFTSVELGGYLAGSLVKISRSLINNNEFGDRALTDFVVNHMAEAIKEFIEGELLKGTGTNTCEGILIGSENVLTSGTAEQIKPDDLIDMQESIPDRYQSGAVWIMHPSTRATLRKFKDTQGNFMLNPDLTSTWGYTLLGKPVYTSEAMPTAETSGKAIIYGDMKGLTVNVHEEMDIQILNDNYATQHAVGVVGWLELDSKVTDQQKLAVLQVQ